MSVNLLADPKANYWLFLRRDNETSEGLYLEGSGLWSGWMKLSEGLRPII